MFTDRHWEFMGEENNRGRIRDRGFCPKHTGGVHFSGGWQGMSTKTTEINPVISFMPVSTSAIATHH